MEANITVEATLGYNGFDVRVWSHGLLLDHLFSFNLDQFDLECSRRDFKL